MTLDQKIETTPLEVGSETFEYLKEDQSFGDYLLEAFDKEENLSEGLELRREELLYKKRTLPMVLDAVKEADLQQREYCRALQYQI